MASTLVSSSSAPRSSGTTPHVSYETFAPRSTAQVARLSRLAALTAGPTARATKPSNDSSSSAFMLHAMSPPPLPSASQEYASTEDGGAGASESAVSVQETLQQTLGTCDTLTNTLKHTSKLRLALRASINIAEDLSNRHADLLRHSGELSAAADRLQEEEAILTKHAQDIGMPLQHYDAVDKIGVQVGVLFKEATTTVRGLPTIKVDNEEYPGVLDQIDAAIDFFSRECGGPAVLQAQLLAAAKSKKPLLSGNVEYYRRALALQQAALDLVREAVADRIATTTSQIAAALGIPKQTVSADQLEASLIYTRFHGISARSNRLLALVRARRDKSQEYVTVLNTCRHAYCVARESLLQQTVRAHMDHLAEQHGPVGMTRLASVFLSRLCTVETALYVDFFGDTQSSQSESTDQNNTKSLASHVVADDGTYYDSEFQAYLTSLCSALHRTVRRSLVTMLDLDTLCQIVSVLRDERSMASSSPTTMAAARAISSVIQDAQERLIFCANTVLTKQVIRFKATPQDLDYPAKLIKKKDVEEEDDDDDKNKKDNDPQDAVERQLQKVYESWFPPMRTVLKILSKIFRVVDPSVFEDMALQSVQACTRCLKDGATYIRTRKGVMHADLFLVKHLLILREQLSPFDMELRSIERQLDFSDAGRAVARFLATRNRRLFSMSTENALLTLLREGVSVQESSVDSKRDLEDALRSACNDFIEHTSKLIAGDLLSLVDQCKAAEANNSLAQQALLNADAIETLLRKTLESVEKEMADVMAQMSLYLDNPATQSILLKPVGRKATRALEETRKLISGGTVDGENGWDAERRAVIEQLVDSVEQATKKVTRSSK